MATLTETITLHPSGYTGSSNMTTSSSYPISNGYTAADSTTYARFSLSTSTTGQIYYTFDASDIPSDATITSVTASARARVSSTSRVTSTKCQLYTGTTAKGSNSTFASTSSTNTFSLTCGTWTRSELDNLRMLVGGTGSSSSQSKYIYFYGADVTITYTVEVTGYTVTSTLTGNGTISPSGETEVISGREYELTITPTDTSETVTVTNNGTDVSSQLVAHGAETSGSAVLGTYTLTSGSFNGSGETYFSGIVGNGYDTSETTSSNYYSGGSGTIAVFTYDMGITLPSSATITRCYCMVNGHAESSSNDSEYMCAMLISGSTEMTEEINFKDVSTSNTNITLECETLPTVSQLAAMKLQCRLGYYGGAINGATLFVEYDAGGGITHYTYTTTISADTVIVVTIGSVSTATMYFKQNGSWVAASKVYKKINGAWVEQSDLSAVFDSNTNYRKG